MAAASNSGSNAMSANSSSESVAAAASASNSWLFQCRITPSRSTISAATVSVIALRDRAQHAVDEAARVVGRELRCEFDGFGDHHGDRHFVVVQQLVRRE